MSEKLILEDMPKIDKYCQHDYNKRSRGTSRSYERFQAPTFSTERFRGIVCLFTDYRPEAFSSPYVTTGVEVIYECIDPSDDILRKRYGSSDIHSFNTDALHKEYSQGVDSRKDPFVKGFVPEVVECESLSGNFLEIIVRGGVANPSIVDELNFINRNRGYFKRPRGGPLHDVSTEPEFRCKAEIMEIYCSPWKK